MKAPNRTETIRLRVTAAEKALVEKKARSDGLTASEYVRRAAGIGHYGRTDLRRAAVGTAGRREDEAAPGTAGFQEAPPRRDRGAAAARAREVLSSI